MRTFLAFTRPVSLALLLCTGACGVASGPADNEDAAAAPAADVSADSGAIGDVVDGHTAPADAAATDTPSDAGTSAGTDTNAGTDAGPPAWLHQCQTDGDCAGLADGNPCTGVLRCNTDATPRRCELDTTSIVTCDPNQDTVCAVNDCNPKSGMCAPKPTPKDTPCVDDDPCTPDSACDGAGQCKAKGSATVCACHATADCAPLTAKNPCAGQWYCDLALFPWACKLNAASAVVCSAENDTTCLRNACGADDGQCHMQPVADGTPCDDGDKLTIGDACQADKTGKST